jgi:hypothetical protein
MWLRTSLRKAKKELRDVGFGSNGGDTLEV